jgi:hypothetical protein
MAVTKTIALSDRLYLRWIEYNKRHPEKIFNQLVREAVERTLTEDEQEQAR